MSGPSTPKVGDRVVINDDAWRDPPDMARGRLGFLPQWRGEWGTVEQIYTGDWRFMGPADSAPMDVARIRLDSLICDPAKVPTLDDWPICLIWVDQVRPLT